MKTSSLLTSRGAEPTEYGEETSGFTPASVLSGRATGTVPTLKALGMVDAFHDGAADFSGMTGRARSGGVDGRPQVLRGGD